MKRLSRRKQFLARTFDSIVGPVWKLAGAVRRTPGEYPVPASILVLEPWRIGDVILATPVLAGLRRLYPRARISLLAQPFAEELLLGTSAVDEFIPAVLPWTADSSKYAPLRYTDPSLRALIARLRASRFDLAIDARMDLRNHLLMWRAGARRRVGYDYGGASYALTDRLTPNDSRPHRVEDWQGILRYLGATGEALPLHLAVLPDEQSRAGSWLSEQGIQVGDLLLGVHPGASNYTKRWAPEKFAEASRLAAERHGARVLTFTDGVSTVDGIPGAVNAPYGSLREMLALIARCDVLLCNDSGPMHAAAALGVPTVSAFTASRADWYAPTGDVHGAAWVDGFACRPCFDACIFSEAYCNTSLSARDVLLVLDRVLGRVATTRATRRVG